MVQADWICSLARSVCDVAYVLSVTVGNDHMNNYTLAQPFDRPPNYTRSLNFQALARRELVFPEMAIPVGSSCLRLIRVRFLAISVGSVLPNQKVTPRNLPRRSDQPRE
jgi:hypothetical protein